MINNKRQQVQYLLLIIFLFSFCLFSISFSQENWTLRSPIPVKGIIGDIAYGNGQYVAVGEYYQIVSSTDGDNWVLRKRNSNWGFLDASVVFANGKFVALSDSIFVSTDGINWTTSNLDTTGLVLRSITYGKGKFVAVGDNGQYGSIRFVATSTDGTTWTRHSLPVHPGCYYNDIVFGTNQFVIVGDSGNIFSSSDGVSWVAPAKTVAFNLNSAIWDGNTFIAVGDSGINLISSSDGISWTKRNPLSSALTLGHHPHIAYGGNGYIVTAQMGFVAFSNNGTNWTLPPTTNRNYGSVMSDGTQFLVADADYGTIYSSKDGTTWEQRSIGKADETMSSVHWTGEKLLAVHNTGFSISTDGIVWGEITANYYNQFKKITNYNNTWVAVGDSFGLFPTISVSSNISTWKTVLTLGSTSKLSDIIYANSQFIAVGDSMDLRNNHYGRILTSPNGLDWVERVSGTQYFLRSIAFGGGKYIAVGDFGTILSSTDGIVWKDYSYTADYLTSITYGANAFIAISDTATFKSTDGINWTKGKIGFYVSKNPQICYGSNQFAIAGGSNVLTSPDGSFWTKQKSEEAGSLINYLSLTDIVYANNQYIAVGNNGVIITSPVSTSIYRAKPVFVSTQQPIQITSKHISYKLSSTSPITIKLFDIRGRISQTLVNTIQPRGEYSLPLSSGLSAGKYILSFRAGTERVDKAIVITR